MTDSDEKKPKTLNDEIHDLIGWLCVKWGFCLPPDLWDEIARQEYLDAKSFARAVLEAEGFQPDYETQWMRKITNRFREHFGQEQVSASEYK
ncbi:MAG: hypothetical protein AAF290_00095 [Pseudomonadota bacterium]